MNHFQSYLPEPAGVFFSQWLFSLLGFAVLLFVAAPVASQDLNTQPEALLINTPAGTQSIASSSITFTAEGGLVENVSCDYQGDDALYIELDTNNFQEPTLLADGMSFDAIVNCTASASGSYSGVLSCDYDAGGSAKTVDTIVDCDVNAGPAFQLDTVVSKKDRSVSIPVNYVASPSDAVVAFDALIGIGEGTLPLPDLSNCGGMLGSIEVACAFDAQGGIAVRTLSTASSNLQGGSLGTIEFDLPNAVNIASSYDLPVNLDLIGIGQAEPSAVGNRPGRIIVTADGKPDLAPDPGTGMAAIGVLGPIVLDPSSPISGTSTLFAFGNIRDLSCELRNDVPELTLGGAEAVPLPPFVLAGTSIDLSVACDARAPGRYSDTVRCEFFKKSQVDVPVDCVTLQGPAITISNTQADPGQAATVDVAFVAGPNPVASFTVFIEPPEIPVGSPDLSQCGGTLGATQVSCSVDSSGVISLTAPDPGSSSAPALPSGALGSITYNLPASLTTPYVYELAADTQFFDAALSEVSPVGNVQGHIGCVCNGQVLVNDDAAGPPVIDMMGTISDQLITQSINLLAVADLSGLNCNLASGGDPAIDLPPPELSIPSSLGAGQSLSLSARCLATDPGQFSASISCSYDSGQTNIPVNCNVDGGPAVQMDATMADAGGTATLNLDYIPSDVVTNFQVEVVFDANFLSVADLSACGGSSALGVGVTCTNPSSGVVNLTTDASASPSLPGSSLGVIEFNVGTPQEFPTTFEVGFNNQKYFDASGQEIEPVGSVPGLITVEGQPIITVDTSSVALSGSVGADLSDTVTFTAQAQLQPGDFDCSLAGPDPELSAQSSYDFTAETAVQLQPDDTFTTTFSCDSSSKGNFSGTYLCVTQTDAGAGLQVELPISCTVN